MFEKILLFFMVLFLVKTGAGQMFQTTYEDDTQEQIKEATLTYTQFAGEEAPLYYGRDYYPNMFLAKGSPFFVSDVFDSGWVAYDGRLYRHVPLRYDLQRNKLITATFGGGSNIIINLDSTDSFSLYSHTFIKLQKDLITNLLRSGFYDRLYSGKIKLLCLRSRGIIKKISGKQIVQNFLDQDKFYVFKDGLYYLVTNKREVYRLLDDHHREVKRKARSARLRWNKSNFENSLIQIIEFYDQLT